MSDNRKYIDTNVTATVHRSPYPAIDPSRPELSQKGRTVLITGGSAGIGFYIARAFIVAGAAGVVITGRRQTALDKAAASLDEFAAEQKTETRIVAEQCDAADAAAVDRLWAGLAHRAIVVDVLVLNHARFAVDKPLLELGVDHVWKSFETNVRPLLHFSEKFRNQTGKGHGPKVCSLNL